MGLLYVAGLPLSTYTRLLPASRPKERRPAVWRASSRYAGPYGPDVGSAPWFMALSLLMAAHLIWDSPDWWLLSPYGTLTIDGYSLHMVLSWILAAPDIWHSHCRWLLTRHGTLTLLVCSCALVLSLTLAARLIGTNPKASPEA